MSVVALAVVVTLATIPPAHATVWAAIRVWRRLSRHARGDGPDANAIFLVSVAPAVLGLSVALLITLPAFLLFEPSGGREQPGLLLSGSAALGAVYVLTAVGRALSMARLSRSCLVTWMRDASDLPPAQWGLPAFAIDARYPVVAIAGVIRPRLLIDRRVLAACSADELRVIAGHELAHAKNYDNARRLLMAACVGSSSSSATEWRHAAEVAADERAASDPDGAAVLAGVLIKIARLATASARPPIPFAAIYDSGSLETRVQRLLSLNPLPARRHWPAPLTASVSVLSVAMAAQAPQWLFAVHSLIERLVHPH